jgi:hypothetical protein
MPAHTSTLNSDIMESTLAGLERQLVASLPPLRADALRG